MIPLTNVVIDNLHLFLRVSDVLINLLITELKRQDAIDKRKAFSDFSIEKHQNLHRFETFVGSLGISDFQFYIGKTSKQLKCRSLTGPEKLKLISGIRVPVLLPTFDSSKSIKIQSLWDKLQNLNRVFSSDNLGTEEVAQFKSRARQ